MDKGKSYYITTPIYYPSAKLHVGHTYCTVMADAMARFKRLQGFNVHFLTGTDEHGQKLQTVAEEKGMKPIDYIDGIVESIKELWEVMEISYDDFIRTTEERHVKRVQGIFNKLYEKGDIYKGEYEGLYCRPCEAYWTESQLVDGKCPDCGREVKMEKEEAYFFRLSKYEGRLIDLFEKNPEFLQPEARRNEMLAFVKQGLQDLCISRSTFDWGIPVPIDEKHVIYVWLDALSNYITALGYPDTEEGMKAFWPADVHLVGKEIVRFHTVIWPAMLMSMELPLPKKVLGHGWLLLDGDKMSKSKNNVVDPAMLIQRYGVDALKYFLLREYTFGQDGQFSNEAMIRRINSDLANDLGNLLSRTVSMLEKYRDGIVPATRSVDEYDESLRQIMKAARDRVANHMDSFSFSLALDEIWKLIGRANKYIDEKMPWKLAKDENSKDSLDACLHNLADTLRIVSILIYPFMHTTAIEMRKQLGLDANVKWEDAAFLDQMEGIRVQKGQALFPRLDVEKELEMLEQINVTNDSAEENDEVTNELEEKPMIEFDDFEKIDLKVGLIEEAEKHPKADRLLLFKVRLGSEIRQIISGVADSFTPEEMKGKKVVVVTNLKPRKIRGLESQGMILYADADDNKVRLVTSDGEPGRSVN